MRSLRSLRLIVACVIIVTSAACVEQDQPGVGAKAINADVAFGTDDEPGGGPESPPAAPANFAPQTGERATSVPALPRSVVTSPRASVPRFPFEARTTTIPAGPNSCPNAGLNEFPDEEAPLNVPD